MFAMTKMLTRLRNFRLRSLECMIYGMSVFVVVGMFYSVGQLHFQQQLSQQSHPGQRMEGRRVLSFFRRSDVEEDGGFVRTGWRDKPYAITQERWRALLRNDVDLEGVAPNPPDRVLDELDGYNAFLSWEDVEDTTERENQPLKEKHLAAFSDLHAAQHTHDAGQPTNAVNAALHDNIQPDSKQVQTGAANVGSLAVHSNEKVERQDSNTPVPGVLVHESFMVKQVAPKASSHTRLNQNEASEYIMLGESNDILNINPVIGRNEYMKTESTGTRSSRVANEGSEYKVKESGKGTRVNDMIAGMQAGVLQHADVAQPANNGGTSAGQPNISSDTDQSPHITAHHDVTQGMRLMQSPGQLLNAQLSNQQDFNRQSHTQQQLNQQQNTQLKFDNRLHAQQVSNSQQQTLQQVAKQQQDVEQIVKLQSAASIQVQSQAINHAINVNSSYLPIQQSNTKQFMKHGGDKEHSAGHQTPLASVTQQRQGFHGDGGHVIVKRDVGVVGDHQESVVKNEASDIGKDTTKDRAVIAEKGKSNQALHYGSQAGHTVLESQQMPSWQVLAKIENDLDEEGRKMQLEMLHYHDNLKQDGGQGVRMLIQKPPSQSSNSELPNSPFIQVDSITSKHNEVLKDTDTDKIGESELYPSNQEMPKNHKHKSSHHHHHHHHNHSDGGGPYYSVHQIQTVSKHSGDSVKDSSGPVPAMTNEKVEQQQGETQLEQGLLPGQPKIYMAMLGRMGNHLFHLASLYGIARATGRIPVVSPGAEIMDAFDPHIKEVYTVGEAPGNTPSVHEQGSGIFTPAVYRLPPEADVVLCCYFQSWRYFVEYSDDLRSIFRFKNWIEKRAQSILLMATRDYMQMQFGVRLPQQVSHTVTYVGVHVRRSDYLLTEHLKRGYKAASISYFLKAMDYFRQKYANVYFVVCSDEIEWAKTHLRDKDVYFVEGQDGLIDLAVLANCNHTVTSVGTYSWWAGWLAGGEVTYYSHWPAPGTEIDKDYKHDDYFMPHWKPFSD